MSARTRYHSYAMPSVSRLRRRVSFAQVIEGEIIGAEKRHCEQSLLEHLTTAGVSFAAVTINSEGCSFIIDSRDEPRFNTAVHELNVAVKLHDHCARVALTRTPTDWPLPSLGRVMQAFDREGIDVVHLASDESALTVLVDERDADRIVAILSRFYQPAA
jgi:aspartokinase